MRRKPALASSARGVAPVYSGSMWDELFERVELLDRECFGDRTLVELLSALEHQIDSIRKEPVEVNVRKQLTTVRLKSE